MNKEIGKAFTLLSKMGTEDTSNPEAIKKITFVNVLSLCLSVVVFSVSFILYFLTKSLFIIVPALFESVLALVPIYLNKRKKYNSAALWAYLVQCAAATYFGLYLANLIELQAMIVFLFLYSFMLFSKGTTRVLCGIICMVVLVILEANAFHPFVEPVHLGNVELIIAKILVSIALMLLIAMVTYRFIKSIDSIGIIKRTNHLLTAKITHDLRTPINAIHQVGLSLDKQSNEDNKNNAIGESVKIILAASSNSLNIINNILGIAKMGGASQDVPEYSNILTEAFFEEIVGINKVLAELSRSRIDLEISDMPPVIYSDPLKLNAIAMNLIANAIKYGVKGGTVHVRVKGSKDQWTLKVINGGKPIPPEKIKKIFEPFVTTQSDFAEGTGLGLFIVKDTVEALKGSIQVESDNNGITTFSVTLPLIKGKMDDMMKFVEAKLERISIDFGDLHILFVEDSPFGSIFIRTALEECGFKQVSHACSGEECLRMAKEDKPDVILMDYNLTGLNGAETIKLLKKDTSLKVIPVIATTGDLYSDSIEKMMAAGACSYLSKPFDAPGLRFVINQHREKNLMDALN